MSATICADEKLLDAALVFTATYQHYRDTPKSVREAHCCAELYPAILGDIRPGDLYAGRGSDGWFWNTMVDFSNQKDNQAGYMMSLHCLDRARRNLGPERHAEIDGLIEFWRHESTFVKVRSYALQTDPEMADYLLEGYDFDRLDYMRIGTNHLTAPKGVGHICASGDTRQAGLMLDFDKLLRLGIPGLEQEVEEKRRQAEAESRDCSLFEGLRISLETVRRVCRHYEIQAREMSQAADKAGQKAELLEMSRILASLQRRKPETLREAIQLLWLYSLLARAGDYSRLDVSLGDFLVADLAAGRLDEAEAERLIMELWRRFDETNFKWNTRVVIGGMGRRNPENADRFALMAMEVTRKFRRIMPVLTLRFHREQNPALFRKALEVIGEGCLYPTLYNDDVYVDGAARIMDIPREDAEGYLPLGCGELIIDHAGSGSPNSAISVPKALEAVLHNGREALTGRRLGPETGPLESFDTFEKLLAAFKAQLAEALRIDVKVHTYCRTVLSRECSLLFQSLLMDDCLERGLDMLSGGLRYFGACNEGFGFTNAGDSLLAIKKAVYEQNWLTLQELVNILDRDFEGHEKERHMLRALPKYGNGDPEADAMVGEIATFIHRTAQEAGRQAGLDYYTVSSVNPGGLSLGRRCAATPDGRKCGEPFAIGDSPTAGYDTSGLTSMLASVAKSDAANGGYITNLKLSKDMFTEQVPKTEALLGTFFNSGGMQLNITVIGRQDLENALREPEKHAHVLVRVGGYSARFIDLDKVTQQEIINRTLY